MQPQQAPPSDDYLARRYKTLLVSVVFVGCTWLLHLVLSPAATLSPAETRALQVGIWVISGVLVLLGVAAILGAGLVSFGSADIVVPIHIRFKALPGITVFFMIVLGGMMSASGGAVNSAFSHYLGATSSVALILAARRRNKLILLLATCLVYWLTNGYVLSSQPSLHGLNGACFTISIWLAALAGLKNSSPS